MAKTKIVPTKTNKSEIKKTIMDKKAGKKVKSC